MALFANHLQYWGDALNFDPKNLHESRLTVGVQLVIPSTIEWAVELIPGSDMTKRDLVNRISTETGLVQQNVLDIVQKTLDHMSECLARGEKVELRNFGVFEIKVRKARIGRNPNQPGTDVPIPERAVVKFKAGKEMREAVSRLDPTKIKAQASSDSESEESDDAEESGEAPSTK